MFLYLSICKLLDAMEYPREYFMYSLFYNIHTIFQITVYYMYSGASRNFKTGGSSPEAVEFMGSVNCYDAPSHTPHVLVVRVENKIHTVHIAF